MLPENQLVLERLNRARREILKTLEGLDAAALDWQPLPGDTNSLGVLAAHAVGAERRWIHRIAGGRETDANRDAEFATRGLEVAALQELCAAVERETEQVLAGLDAADMEREHDTPRGRRSTRYTLLHALEHYNEHLGHMGLTRQWWEHRF